VSDENRSLIIFNAKEGKKYYLVDIKNESYPSHSCVIWSSNIEEALEFVDSAEAENFIYDYADSLDRQEVTVDTMMLIPPQLHFTL
jgi:hypothetical protein